MAVAGINIDAGSIMAGVGTLAKDLRAAITGKDPIDGTKAAELALQAQEISSKVDLAQLAVVIAESQSADKWTSRGRPMFLYVVYILLLSAIPMGVVAAFDSGLAANIAGGFKAWLEAIPGELYALFGAGYLGYGTFRSIEKSKGVTK